MTKEEIYDQIIAPKLLEIGQLCQQHDLPFVAAVEYEPYSLGRTAYWDKGAGIAIKTVDWAVQSHGNGDTLIWAMMRYATEYGHASACLRILGVPETPVSK